MKFRAAYWVAKDRQYAILLTMPEESHLGDDELRCVAQDEANEVGLDMEQIEVGEWSDPGLILYAGDPAVACDHKWESNGVHRNRYCTRCSMTEGE